MTDPAQCHHPITGPGCSNSTTASLAGRNSLQLQLGSAQVAQGTVLCPVPAQGWARRAGEQGWLWRALPMALPPAHPDFLEE